MNITNYADAVKLNTNFPQSARMVGEDGEIVNLVDIHRASIAEKATVFNDTEEHTGPYRMLVVARDGTIFDRGTLAATLNETTNNATISDLYGITTFYKGDIVYGVSSFQLSTGAVLAVE